MFARLFVLLALVTSTAWADSASKGAMPHAERLVARIQAFDTDGIISLTHIPTVERLGMTAEQMRQAMLDAN